MLRLHSLVHGYPVFPAPFVQKTVLSLLNGLGPLVKNHFTIYARVHFWALYSVPLARLSVCRPVTHHVYQCDFAVRSGTGTCEFSNFALPRIVLAPQGPLRFHINFTVDFSISARNIVGILIGIALTP